MNFSSEGILIKISMGRKLTEICFIIVSCFCFAITAYTDDIHLKNGKTLVGDMTGETDEYVEIRLKTGKVKLRASDIKSIEEKELPPGFFKEDKPPVEEKVSADVSSNTIEKDDEPKKKEGSGKDPKSSKLKYNISIEAKYSNKESQEIIDVNGVTDLPSGALIYVFFKRLNTIF